MKPSVQLLALICAAGLSTAFVTGCSSDSNPPPAPPSPPPMAPEPAPAEHPGS